MDPLLLQLPTKFASDHLLLRPYNAGDAEMYFQMLQANWEHLYEYLPKSLMAIRNPEDVVNEFRQQESEWKARNLFIFGAWEMRTHSHVGEVYLANADWDVPSLEVGYFITHTGTGKGYATEVARAAIRYAFENMHLNRIVLRCATDNPASKRVAEKCGFTLEGCFRQSHRKKDGSLVDMLWYSLLLSEWSITP